MYDLEQTKRQILDRVDIQQVVGEHVNLKRSGKRWLGLCCFHNEKTPSLTVNPEQGIFKCFGCGQGGDVFTFVQLRENVSFMESMQILADRVGVELSTKSHREPTSGPSRADVARANAWALRFFRSNLLDPTVGRSARAYVADRGISDASSEVFSLGLTPGSEKPLLAAAARAGMALPLLLAADLVRKGEDGHTYETFRDRLIFPIRDATGRVIGFGGRTLIDDRAKYLNTRQNILFDKGRNLYGIDLARGAIADRKRSVIVEGYTDCIACHQAGFQETIATLGTALTEAQVHLLRRYCECVVLLFDSDRAGEDAAERAVSVALPQCMGVRLARIPSGKDPSEFLASKGGASGFLDVLNGAVDALEFLWKRTTDRFVTEGSDANRRAAVLNFLGLLSSAYGSGAVDAIQRGLLVNQVAHLLRMDPGEISRLLVRLGKRRVRASEPAVAASVTPGRPLSADQAAWQHLLEVLLNRPDAADALGALPDPRDIADERDRRIARAVVEVSSKGGGGESSGLAEVLSQFHDPEDVDRITELARRGEERGNYENTLRVALERIGTAQSTWVVERSKERVADQQSQRQGSEGVSDELTTLREGVASHRHFAPRRMIRQMVDGVSLLDQTAHQETTSAME